MSQPVYKLYFTGRDDPRNGCIVIGEDTKPIFFRFDTPDIFMGNARTAVTKGNGDMVAFFEWTGTSHPGSATIIGDRQIPMGRLVMTNLPFTPPGSRVFESSRGGRYAWRKPGNGSNAYDVRRDPPVPIGIYRRFVQWTPIGPSYAYMQYTFDDDVLLLDSLLALSLNRWLDLQGL
ncbi:hypothetical protein GLOTRDRAFT_35791 [Gloeophyllum trabeum ATCC 11539]|uniref:DUF6593 domain-containing protein n=1 Tax=Gloeophyllum trabeum (strain ATCC 11539 / FP-39264 / Madison 617) TaxID=670483 RepID=S7QF10_GLOTA|nr:uncharacterized protein GLOTRDRAFT_35791 [Gloeophyllum trabeum ATCC 11539]EPQ58416.1 hypothetical protein GLOTRDRAFT_35791 [Gloeophyllum trabeum ATCC 11539]